MRQAGSERFVLERGLPVETDDQRGPIMEALTSSPFRPAERPPLTSKIYEFRKQKKWTLKKLAEMSGIPFNTVWRMEKGYGTALRNAYKLADVFQVTIYELWSIPSSGAVIEAQGDVLSVSGLRLQRGWGLSELAELSGVSKTTLFQIEKGHIPALENAVRIATVLGVSVYQIWKP